MLRVLNAFERHVVIVVVSFDLIAFFFSKSRTLRRVVFDKVIDKPGIKI